MVRHPRDIKAMKERLKIMENFLVRLLIIVYVLIAHFAMIIFKLTTGLRIQWINHKPWPYKQMWNDFREGFDDE